MAVASVSTIMTIACVHMAVTGDAADAVDVECGVYGIPGLVAADGQAFAALVALAEGNPSLIVSEPMRAAIDFKWHSFGVFIWQWQVARFIAFVASWTVGLHMLLVSMPPQPSFAVSNAQAEGWSGSFIIAQPVATLLSSTQLASIPDGAFIFSLVPLLALLILWEEVLQCRAVGIAAYLRSASSYADLSLVAIAAALSWLLLQGDTALAAELGACGTVVLLLKGFQVARGSKRMAFLVTMLGEILLDMAPFLVLQLAVVLAYSYASLLLHLNDSAPDEYASLYSAAFTSYNLLVHAAGTDSRVLYHDSSLTIVLFYYLSTLFVPVVMLNALIAIMGDTYDRVSETRIERGLQQRATMLVEMENMMFFKGPSRGFGRWLHAVRRTDGSSDGAGVDEWSGRMHAMNHEMGKVERRQLEMMAGQARMEASLAQIMAATVLTSPPAQPMAKVAQVDVREKEGLSA